MKAKPGDTFDNPEKCRFRSHDSGDTNRQGTRFFAPCQNQQCQYSENEIAVMNGFTDEISKRFKTGIAGIVGQKGSDDTNGDKSDAKKVNRERSLLDSGWRDCHREL